MKHILIMEDNIALALNWKTAFELLGHKITMSTTGDEAITFLRSETFDLVITDMVVLGESGGLTVLLELHKMGKKAPPAIAVTGALSAMRRAEEQNLFLQHADNLGAAISLEKPFSPSELVFQAEALWQSLEA